MVASLLVVTGPSGAGKTTVARIVAGSFTPAALLRMDDFTPFIVNGGVDQSLPEASRQHEVLGSAVAAAAIRFAAGGYTTVMEGVVLPDALPELGDACRDRGVTLHYAVLRAALGECLTRASARNAARGLTTDPGAVESLYARFAELESYEANVVDATPGTAEVAQQVLAGYAAGRLLVSD